MNDAKLCIPLLRLEYSPEEIEWIKDEIEKVLRSGYLTMAERVWAFETRFAQFCGTRHAIGTNSGTSAIEIALRTIDVRGGTVVMPSNTYMATPIAAIKAGASVIFAECQWENMQMDPDDLAAKIRSDTRAVIVVHIGGIISPHIERIQEICRERGIPLIEDAAHAHGALFNGQRAGSLGVAGCFSFYPTKVLTTAEGGMLVTDDDNLHAKAIILREHGKADHKRNIHVEVGDNWRFSELHAVLGLQQMDKADQILDERRRLANLYDELLAGFGGVQRLSLPPTVVSSYYKYIAYLPATFDRSHVKEKMLSQHGVQLTGEVYADPCHSQPLFKKYPEFKANTAKDCFPVTESVCRRHICLPLYPGLHDDEVAYVVSSLKQVLKEVS